MIDKTVAHIEANRDAFVERLMDLLRIPSISTEPERKDDINRCAQWVHEFFTNAGIASEIVETPGHPCVLGDTGPVQGNGPTVLIYGHYDVQPVGNESLWDSPPFEPLVRDGAIVARGSADDKGQMLAHLLAAESWMKTAGQLPLRVKFLIEGEEEIGSPNFEHVLTKHRDRLACDYVALSDTPKFDVNTPAITYGTKGILYKEIILLGPKHDLHSGSFGGTLANPCNALAAIINSLHDACRRVTIPGFYDDVRELGDDERARLDALAFDEAAYLKATGAPALAGEEGFSTLQRRWARPTLDVNGLYGGFSGEGASMIIPAKGGAKVSMRLVPDQDPDRISSSFDEAVRAAAPPGVKLEIKTHASCPAYLCPIDSPGVTAAVEAFEAGFGKRPVFIREGGTLPILPMFRDVLGADSVLLGFCDPNCRAHGPNEFFSLEDFHNGIKTAAHFLDRIAQAT